MISTFLFPGDFGLFALLKPIAYAHHPLLDRVENLQVSKVSLIYGDHDWMDIRAGFEIQKRCLDQPEAPLCDVYACVDSGHQLMLDAPHNFVETVRAAVGLGAPLREGKAFYRDQEAWEEHTSRRRAGRF